MNSLLTFLPFPAKNNDPSQRFRRWNGPKIQPQHTMARSCTPIPQLTEQNKRNFYKKIPTTPTETGCLEWLACRDRDGYGAFGIGGKMFRASRVAYFIYYGADPGNLEVCHTCDNPSCVNPECLFLGTSLDNGVDMASKGRAAKGDKNGARLHPDRLPRGEAHGCSKLKNSDITAIRADPRILREIAAEYSVSLATISYIKRRETWKGVA